MSSCRLTSPIWGDRVNYRHGRIDELASIPRDDRQKTAIRNAKNQRMGDVIPGDRLPCASEQYAKVVRRARGFTLYVRELICV